MSDKLKFLLSLVMGGYLSSTGSASPSLANVEKNEAKDKQDVIIIPVDSSKQAETAFQCMLYALSIALSIL